MGDFGGTLRSARERKGISLRHIANATKISMGALEALERNDFGRLPGGIFSRSFVRAYAQEVGLDPDQTVSDFLREAGETFEPPPEIADENAPILVERDDPALDFRKTWRPGSFSLSTWALIVLLVGVPGAAWVTFVAMRTATPTAPAAGGSDQAQQARQPGEPAPSNPPAPPATPDPTGPIPDLEPGQTMRLVLEPTAECWVALTVDGEPKVSRILYPGERETLEIREGAVLTVGDAGAMTFTINGRPSKPIGERGVVETLRITRTNFKDFIR